MTEVERIRWEALCALSECWRLIGYMQGVGQMEDEPWSIALVEEATMSQDRVRKIMQRVFEVADERMAQTARIAALEDGLRFMAEGWHALMHTAFSFTECENGMCKQTRALLEERQ